MALRHQPLGDQRSHHRSPVQQGMPRPGQRAGGPLDEPRRDSTRAQDLQQALGWNGDAKLAAGAWATLTILSYGVTVTVARTWARRGAQPVLRRLSVYALATPLLLASLLGTFVSVDRWLPAL